MIEPPMSGTVARASLVTGYPSPVARHLAGLIVGRGGRVALIVRARDLRVAERWAQTLGNASRVHQGDPGAVDLGLAGPLAAALQRDLDAFYHLEPPPLFGRSSRPLRAAREVVAFAAGTTPPARVVALSRIPMGEGHAYRPGSPAGVLRTRAVTERSGLERVLSGRGASLGASVLSTGVPVDPEGPWSGSPEGKLLHVLVLMHLSVDIRRLRSVASRRLVLTSASMTARVALAVGSGDMPGVVHLDLGDVRAPTLAAIDRSLPDLLGTIPEVDAEFLSTCRRNAEAIAGRWTGGEDPVDVLASFTVNEPRGDGERVARDLDLEFLPTMDVLAACLRSVVQDMRADIRTELEAETRDALLK